MDLIFSLFKATIICRVSFHFVCYPFYFLFIYYLTHQYLLMGRARVLLTKKIIYQPDLGASKRRAI